MSRPKKKKTSNINSESINKEERLVEACEYCACNRMAYGDMCRTGQAISPTAWVKLY